MDIMTPGFGEKIARLSALSAFKLAVSRGSLQQNLNNGAVITGVVGKFMIEPPRDLDADAGSRSTGAGDTIR